MWEWDEAPRKPTPHTLLSESDSEVGPTGGVQAPGLPRALFSMKNEGRQKYSCHTTTGQ